MITSQLLITGLQLDVIIGIHPHERLASQRLVLDVELDINISTAAHSDNIEDALDYASLVQQLIAWTAQREFQLIEALAHHLITKLLEQPKISQACLKLSKFPADLPITSASVMCRGRSCTCPNTARATTGVAATS